MKHLSSRNLPPTLQPLHTDHYETHVERYAQAVIELEDVRKKHPNIEDIALIPTSNESSELRFEVMFIGQDGPVAPPETTIANLENASYHIIQPPYLGRTAPYGVRANAKRAEAFLEYMEAKRASETLLDSARGNLEAMLRTPSPEPYRGLPTSTD